MINTVSQNTQAILLLTAPLIAGHNDRSADLLSLKEYNSLAISLHEVQQEPGNLLNPESSDILNSLIDIQNIDRLKHLLKRGFLLSQALENWQSKSIWVTSRADPEYPEQMKSRLKNTAPPLLYGCGDSSFLEGGGLAIVGSRHIDEELKEYTSDTGKLAAESGFSVVSGGAKGIDQAAMSGALQAGGKVIGVVADSLTRAVLSRDLRDYLIDSQLVLISPYDPSAGFNVGNAMQRNKVIYALADAALVVNSDLRKGGTWAGAIEQLEKHRFLPVYVRSPGESDKGLKALQDKGAGIWPDPSDSEEFTEIMNQSSSGTVNNSIQSQFDI